jgi:hypothetical protein
MPWRLRALLILIDDAGVVHPPTNAITDRPRGWDMSWVPPQIRIRAEDLLPIPTAANIEFTFRTLFAFQVLDRSVVFQNKLQVKLDEVRQCEDQQQAHQISHDDANTAGNIPAVNAVWALCQITESVVELGDGGEDDDDKAAVRIEKELHEELAVVEADTIVDPGAMMVHVEDAAVADTAVVSPVWLPYVAHLAIPPPLCLVAHIKPPIRRHHTWVCPDALVED